VQGFLNPCEVSWLELRLIHLLDVRAQVVYGLGQALLDFWV